MAEFSGRYILRDIYESLFSTARKMKEADNDNWCLIAVDIISFRLFNDNYGRERGDKLLALTTEVLKKHENENFFSVYLGNDDFVIFTKYDIEKINELYDEINKTISGLENTIGFVPSMGIYRVKNDEEIDLDCLDKAVSAMLKSKNIASPHISEYSNNSYNKDKDEISILNRLKKAVDNGYVSFYLQPQVRISTGKVVGAEALSRWIEPDGSSVSPAEFIPVLEKRGFIADFDRIIWEQVFKWLNTVINDGIKPVPISLNVSQIDIISMDVTALLLSLCEKYSIPSSLIKVEITESAYAEHFDEVNAEVLKLKSKGFLVMMDDFGSGYSSLNMLENISTDVIKLDMVFIKNTSMKSRRGITIIESIINMAKMLGLPIVVEGVETEDQVEFLRGMGCRYAQGFFFHKPMPKEQFITLLNDDKADYRGFQLKKNDQFHVREFLDENTFTDTMLNSILGAVAYYSLDGQNLTITRFNEMFYRAIADVAMEERQSAIQNYVVREDWPLLYKALDAAVNNVSAGATCEIRFYKSDDSVFWFRMHFFFLRNEGNKKIFYGQVQDVTEEREQSLQFFEVLHQQSAISFKIDLNLKTIQYITDRNTFFQIGLPSIDLELSSNRTMETRIADEEDRQLFKQFFDPERLKLTHSKAIYHESIKINFRLVERPEPLEFSTYYIRPSKEQDLFVYVFAKRLNS